MAGARKSPKGPSAAPARRRQSAALTTPTDLPADAVAEVAGGLNLALADTLALYLKTKNFHWHVSGPHFRDYHRLLDDQSAELLASTDAMAERVRKLGGTTIRSIGHVARIQRVADNDAEFVSAGGMLAELREDNTAMAARLRELHGLCDDHNDVATASLLENWIDQAEGRAWFLFETTRRH